MRKLTDTPSRYPDPPRAEWIAARFAAVLIVAAVLADALAQVIA